MQLKQFYNIASKVSSRKKCYNFWWSIYLTDKGALPVPITPEYFSKFDVCIIVITKEFIFKPIYYKILFPCRYVIMGSLIVFRNMTLHVSLTR